MLVPAVAFSDFILAIHILAVVIAFGGMFAYPLFFTAALRADPSVVPWLLRTMHTISRRLINPGLLVVLVAGIYLASDEHQWSSFYVGWGVIAVIALGALEGAIQIPRGRKLAEVAERDLAATAVPGSGSGGATRTTAQWSPEFQAHYKVLQTVGTIQGLIVIVTVFLMATHAGR
jgi:uncharacterized membrane protein